MSSTVRGESGDTTMESLAEIRRLPFDQLTSEHINEVVRRVLEEPAEVSVAAFGSAF